MEGNVEAVTAMEIFLSYMVNHAIVIKALGITCLIMSITSKRMVRIDTLFELLERLLQNHLQMSTKAIILMIIQQTYVRVVHYDFATVRIRIRHILCVNK